MWAWHACKNYVLNNSLGDFALLNVSAFMKMQNFSSCEGRREGWQREGQWEWGSKRKQVALMNNEHKFQLCQVKRMLFNLLTFIAAKLGN